MSGGRPPAKPSVGVRGVGSRRGCFFVLVVVGVTFGVKIGLAFGGELFRLSKRFGSPKYILLTPPMRA